jgi:hypothetical protein
MRVLKVAGRDTGNRHYKSHSPLGRDINFLVTAVGFALLG